MEGYGDELVGVPADQLASGGGPEESRGGGVGAEDAPIGAEREDTLVESLQEVLGEGGRGIERGRHAFFYSSMGFRVGEVGEGMGADAGG
jgi:hypothetical protein